jgi:hypothetical protein
MPAQTTQAKLAAIDRSLQRMNATLEEILKQLRESKRE